MVDPVETTFVRVTPVDSNPATGEDLKQTVINHDTTDNDEFTTITLSIFGTDDMSDMIDAAISWAETNPAADCHDQDSCRFFFDGYALNLNIASDGFLQVAY